MSYPNFKNVCVLMGGASNERAVSIETGANVANALASIGSLNVTPLVIDDDSLAALPPSTDACYIALHGGWGESGGVQRELDSLGIPYTGPGADACALTMDKIATKRVLDRHGVPNARWAAVHTPTLPCPLPLPCVVKPPMDGSSVGISKVSAPEQWSPALETAFAIDREYRLKNRVSPPDPVVLAEEFIPGREMTVGVIGSEVLPPVEICTPQGWYGYDEKYKSNDTRYVFPSDPFIPEMQSIALAAFNATGCRGIARVDFRISPEGKMYVLELNTSPGMTSHSLIPKAAAKIGLDFPTLCHRILRTASHD